MKTHKVFKLNALFALLLSFMLTIICLPSLTAHADVELRDRVIKVGVTSTKGLSSINADGTRSGIIIDYLYEIAKYTGWSYEFHDYDGAMEMIDDTVAGDLDLIGGNYTGLESYYPTLLYPDYSCGYVQNVLFARSDDTSFQLHDLTSMSGKRFGVFKPENGENAAIGRLESFLSFYGITEYEIITYSDSSTLKQHLIDDDVDLILGNTFNDYDFRVIATFNSREHYLVTTDTQVLSGLNSALKWIYESNPQFASEVYNKNTTDNSQVTISLSDDEKAYVEEKGSIKVAVKDDFAPLFTGSNTKSVSGVTNEILDLIAEFTGFEIEYVYADSYFNAIELVTSNQADVLGFFLDGEEEADSYNLALTSSYATLSRVIIKNKAVSYPSTNLKAGILKGRHLPDDIAAMASDTVEYDTLYTMTKAVDNGEIDFAYGYSSYFERVMQDNFFTNVQLVTLANNQSDISFAMSKPVDALLFTSLNKAIYNISTTTKDEILANNLISDSVIDYSLTTIIVRHPGIFAGVVCGAALLFLVIIFVLSFYKLRQTKIKNELTMATASNIAKSDFLSRMSHEIKTPMNSIIALADLTSMRTDMTPPVKENVDKIRSSSQYLLRLINDILDMSRIENSKMTIGNEPFSIGRMLDELRSMIDTEASKKGVTVNFEIKIRHDILVGDNIRLRQVLTNLLANAIKFTEFGDNITLSAVENGLVGENNVSLTFHVKDTGMGITKDDQSRIFKVFEQAGSTFTKSQGVGLGLAISYNLVQLMGGDLRVSSEFGKGSDFYFTIALPQGEMKIEDLSKHASDNYLATLNILIVEDNELNAEITSELLQIKGAKATIAKNGREAVEIFAKSKPNEFDAILMDIQMPIMNGLEATKTIRALHRLDSSTTPIIAMTANTFKEDVDLAYSSGMDAFLSKPIDVNKLYSIIIKHTAKDE